MKKIMLLLAYFTACNATYSQADKVDNAIKDLMQKNRIVGLQLAVIKDNVIVKTSHYGLASVEDSIAVDSQTIFSINSITCAVALSSSISRTRIIYSLSCESKTRSC